MNRAIPDHIIEEIRARADIVDVIGSAIPLKRSGNGSYKALCPFHNEKTPSFTVNAVRQGFHCFGCGKGGDVFRFIMEKEGVDFPNAAHILAGRYGVVIPEKTYDRNDPDKGRRLADARERLYRINDEFASFFERSLNGGAGADIALQYLNKRGIDAETVRKFRIGYAPDEWDAGVKYGRSLGFSETEMIECGVVKQSEKANRCYDFFKGRLIFPIWNETGRVVGFSARTLDPEAKVAKYVNTQETPVFKKGALLYALPLARTSIIEHGRVILCEGQLDTIAFHRAGMIYAVAPQGTGFTEEQARILKRYTDCVLLSFDSDAAGQKAILRAIEILLGLDFEIKTIALPGGKDPDELFRTGGADALLKAETEASDWLSFILKTLPGKHDLASAAGRSRAAAEVISYLRLVGNRVALDMYLHQAADFLRIKEESLIAELRGTQRAEQRKIFSKNPENSAPDGNAVQRSGALERSEAMLLELALNFDFIPHLLAGELSPEWLSGRASGVLLKRVMECCDDEAVCGKLVREYLESNTDPELSALLVRECTVAEESAEKAAGDCISEIRNKFRRRQSAALREKLSLGGLTVDEEISILQQIKELGD